MAPKSFILDTSDINDHSDCIQDIIINNELDWESTTFSIYNHQFASRTDSRHTDMTNELPAINWAFNHNLHLSRGIGINTVNQNQTNSSPSYTNDLQQPNKSKPKRQKTKQKRTENHTKSTIKNFIIRQNRQLAEDSDSLKFGVFCDVGL